VLTDDAEEARTIGRAALDRYFNLTNYVSNWKRLGFTDADVTRPGSNELIDAVVAHGTSEDVATRLSEYLTAGANHVAILVHGGAETVLPTLSKLAGPLGLSP
jgi:alkanesulfonate monooxygenase SsuD/methylene tetrahydromethanopterin reductase-like flavin-dependent oxidoreductase (luciferase family)